MVSGYRQMACGAVCLDLVISLGMWVTADLRLCDKLGLLVFYSCSWGQLAVLGDLRGLTDSELRMGVVDTPYVEPQQVTMLAKTRIPLYHEKASDTWQDSEDLQKPARGFSIRVGNSETNNVRGLLGTGQAY